MTWVIILLVIIVIELLWMIELLSHIVRLLTWIEFTFRTIIDFNTYRSSDSRIKKAIIRASVNQRFESFARRVIVDKLDRQDRSPNLNYFSKATVMEGERFVVYAQ